MASSSTNYRVIYIASASRSGSTVFARDMGEANLGFPLGEVVNVPKRLGVDAESCGCGNVLEKCNYWSAVFRDAGIDQKALEALVECRPLVFQVRHVLHYLVSSERGVCLGQQYFSILRSLYNSLAKHSPSSTLVDASKTPTYAIVLSRFLKLDLWLVHLVRDPRAVVYSQLTPKKWKDRNGIEREIRPTKLVVSAIRWVRWNFFIECLRLTIPKSRRIRVRYEDFTRDTSVERKRLVAFGLVPDTDLSARGQHHIAAGNPSRFENRQIEFDGRYIENLTAQQWLLTTFITWPLLLWYSIPITRRGVKRLVLD